MDTTTEDGTTTDRAGAGEVKLGELCDACGQVVDARTAIREELTVNGAMCPSPMTFHPGCYEAASVLWQPDTESYCTADPLYPETGQWVLPEDPKQG